MGEIHHFIIEGFFCTYSAASSQIKITNHVYYQESPV